MWSIEVYLTLLEATVVVVVVPVVNFVLASLVVVVDPITFSCGL